MKFASAVIVTHNSAGVIQAALDSCLAHGLEVIVVDNASRDETVALARSKSVAVIANRENRGFAAAANQGFAAAGHDAVLLLNPDAILQSGVEYLVEACSKPGVAACAGQLLDPKGRIQQGFYLRRLPTLLTLCFEVLGINRLWPSNPVNRRYRYARRPVNEPGFVEQPAGAFLMIRKEAWRQLGGFDPSFHPLWFEDVDFCKRLIDRGLRVWYEPRAAAIHSGAHSIRQLRWEDREIYWYASLLKYACKHFSWPSRALVCLAVMGGALLRAVAGIRRHGIVRPVRIYGKVIRLACHYLLMFGGSAGGKNGSRKSFNQARIHAL